jgi:hypothetical protein
MRVSARPSRRFAIRGGILLLGFVIACGAFSLFLRMFTSHPEQQPSRRRTISPDQAQRLAQELVKHKPHTITVKADPSDREAVDYSRQLGEILGQAGWRTESAAGNQGPGLGEGICIAQTGEDERAQYLDTTQDPYFFLPGAFASAGVDIECESGQAAGDFKLYLLVGGRPQAVTPPRHSRLGSLHRWIWRHLRLLRNP